MAIALTPATYAVLLAAERARPGRAQPAVAGWYAKGTAWFALAAVAYLTLVPAATALSPVHTPAAAAPLAFVLADAMGWFVHHALHRARRLWRWTHQLHHSAERIDVAGAMYLHPFDAALQLATLALAVVALGVPPAGAALAAYLSIAAQLFVHTNLRTPQWLGWFIQRPEAHAVHHARGIHAYNYGLLPLWDRMFGTFRNPSSFTTEPAGFWDGSSREVFAMLAGRDVGEGDHR